MLKIRIDQAIYVQQNLLQQLRSLDSAIGELEQAMQQLNGLSGMDGVLMGLRRQKDRLEESRRTLDRMSRCMEQTILYYNSCEDRICDYALQEIIIYRRHRIGTSNLSGLSGLLQSILYTGGRKD
ncbi:MAG: hypothetical protein K2P63_03125 [Lachnospiraceae bacterium]|nr:hypothetical protein [Lachnospiraceae bacterium]